LLIDAGANVECTPEYLLQFAYMGSFYVEGALGIANPRVGLLNNGAEDTKGGEARLAAYELLSKAEGINFIGNVEGRDPLLGVCDVVVTDGFSGNVFLKASEGAAMFIMGELKSALTQNIKSKVAAALLMRRLKIIKEKFNPDSIGGTIMLGIKRPVIKAHGSSGSAAIVSAVSQAVTAVDARVAEKLAEAMPRLTVSEE